MKILGVGLEVIDQRKWIRDVRRYGDHFFTDFFSPQEIGYCREKKHPREHFCARWACKLAICQALSLAHDLRIMRSIEIMPDRDGCPKVKLSKSFFRDGFEKNLKIDVKVSLTHSDSFAAAEAVVVTKVR